MAAPLWQSGNLYIPGDIVQPVTAPAPNVPAVVNGDFSAGATGWDYTGGAAYVLDGHGYGGNGCVRLPGNTPDGLALNQTKLYVEPGGTLTASCMIEQGASAVRATAGWVEIHWFAADDTPVQAPDKGNEVNDGRGGAWHKSTVASARPAAATYARAGIHLTSVADHNHPIWGDALTVSGASAGLPAGLVYKAVQPEAGTSAANEPAWPSILGQQVIDNEVIWEAVTTSRITWTASPRYLSGATEPVWPEDMGGMVQDGSINWRAVPRRVEDEKCPNSKVVAILASKVFAADRDIVRFSATANPLDWSTVEDAGYLATGLQQANANDMAVLMPYRKNLTAWNASSFQNWQADPDPASMALLDQMDGIGSTWPHAAVPVANDLFYLAALGVRSVGIANAAENLASNDVGAPIDILVQQSLLSAVANESKVLGTYYPSAGQYWLAFADFPPSPLSLSGDVPDGFVGEEGSYQYVAAGGIRPYQFSVASGAIPPGASLSVSGVLTYEWLTPGSYSFEIQVVDATGESLVVPDTVEVIQLPMLLRAARVGTAEIVIRSPDGLDWSAPPIVNAPTSQVKNYLTGLDGRFFSRETATALPAAYSDDLGQTWINTAENVVVGEFTGSDGDAYCMGRLFLPAHTGNYLVSYDNGVTFQPGSAPLARFVSLKRASPALCAVQGALARESEDAGNTWSAGVNIASQVSFASGACNGTDGERFFYGGSTMSSGGIPALVSVRNGNVQSHVLPAIPGATNLNAFGAGNGMKVVGTNNGRICFDRGDGAGFQIAALDLAGSGIRQLHWCWTHFIAVTGPAGGGPGAIYTSPDGETWTLRPMAGNYTVYSLAQLRSP